MSPHTTSRTSVLRRGLVALATAATLLAGGLVAAPASQAAQLPVVDVDKRPGTTVTTRMSAFGATVEGIVDTDRLTRSPSFTYQVDVDWTGGKKRSITGRVTLQRGSVTFYYPLEVDVRGDGRHRVVLPRYMKPGSYRVGIELTAEVKRADGTVNRHRVDVNDVRTIAIRRSTTITSKISPAKADDGRPSRLSGKVEVLAIGAGGDLSMRPVTGGNVTIAYDPNGPWLDGVRDVVVRKVPIRSDGTFTTVVPARDRWWKVVYQGNTRFAPSYVYQPQGDRGCGC